ncbi:MAG: prepilin peptidase [Planctomycetales bacterium]
MVAVLLAIDACSLAKKYSSATKGRVTTSRMLLSAVAAAVSIYMILLPTVDWIISSNTPPSSGVLEEMSSSEWVRLKTMEVFFAVWFFAVGASIGSFLNVVAYRLPRRESLVFRSSKCPHCGVQIQSRDNVPLLGWLKLGGRCRNCAAPISMRYPIVEAVTGGAFLVLYFVELISGGSNLPVRQPNAYAGVVWILMYTKWDLVGLYLFHCAVLCTLLSWGLIRVDDHRVPLGSIFSATAVVMGTICCFPGLVIVPWRAEVPPLLQEIPYAQVLCTAGIGWLAGLLSGAAVLAVVAWRKETSARLPSLEFAAGFGLVGLAWGWQSVFLIAIFTAMLQQVLRTEELRKIFQVPCPPEISLPIVAYLNLLGWRVVSELPAQAWQYFSAL